MNRLKRSRKHHNKKKKISRNKLIIVGFSILIISFILIYIIGTSSMEYYKKPMIKDYIKTKDYKNIYNIYFSKDPYIKDYPYFGSGPITFIIYLQINSNSSREFFKSLYPKIEALKEVRFYFKDYLTYKDIYDRNERYKFALASECIKRINKSLYFKLINITDCNNLLIFINKTGIRKEFMNCINNDSIVKLTATEVESFGIITIPRFYVGIKGKNNIIIDGLPSFKKFKRVIRNYETLIGK